MGNVGLKTRLPTPQIKKVRKLGIPEDSLSDEDLHEWYRQFLVACSPMERAMKTPSRPRLSSERLHHYLEKTVKSQWPASSDNEITIKCVSDMLFDGLMFPSELAKSHVREKTVKESANAKSAIAESAIVEFAIAESANAESAIAKSAPECGEDEIDGGGERGGDDDIDGWSRGVDFPQFMLAMSCVMKYPKEIVTNEMQLHWIFRFLSPKDPDGVPDGVLNEGKWLHADRLVKHIMAKEKYDMNESRAAFVRIRSGTPAKAESRSDMTFEDFKQYPF
eukprot:m.4410 g.4410  ORF g.4410 m.4410 type:complete len:278 (+) comp10688_c0_seq1:54-887(+)